MPSFFHIMSYQTNVVEFIMYIQPKLNWQNRLKRFNDHLINLGRNDVTGTKQIVIEVIDNNSVAKLELEIPNLIKFIAIDNDGTICGYESKPVETEKTNPNAIDLKCWDIPDFDDEFIDLARIHYDKGVMANISNWQNCIVEVEDTVTFIIV